MKNSKQLEQMALLWISFYIIVLSFVDIVLTFLIFKLPFFLVLATFVSVLTLAIWLWRRSVKDISVYFYSILNMFGGVLLGVLLTYWISGEDRLISFLIGIAVMDLITFTKLGRWTPHRRLIESKGIIEKLSICAPIPVISKLIPIIGIGDIFCYALMVGATLKIWGVSSLWIPIVSIFLGQILNIFGIFSFRSKPWYRGIPATTLPILFFVGGLGLVK